MDLALELDDRPASRAPAVVPLSRSEHEIGRTVANLLDSELERRSPSEGRGWIAEQFGVSVDALRPETLRIPASLATVLPAGTLIDIPIGVQLNAVPTGVTHLTLFSPGGNAKVLSDAMGRLYELAADSAVQPVRGRTLRVGGRRELEVATQAPLSATRADLALPEEVWRDIDTNVHGLFRNREALQRLGLGLDRGVLLTGPPGTGKTHLCQVVASELADQGVTVILPSPDAAQAHLFEIYDLATWLAPGLVVLADIDLIAGRRGGRTTSGRSTTPPSVRRGSTASSSSRRPAPTVAVASGSATSATSTAGSTSTSSRGGPTGRPVPTSARWSVAPSSRATAMSPRHCSCGWCVRRGSPATVRAGSTCDERPLPSAPEGYGSAGQLRREAARTMPDNVSINPASERNRVLV